MLNTDRGVVLFDKLQVNKVQSTYDIALKYNPCIEHSVKENKFVPVFWEKFRVGGLASASTVLKHLLVQIINPAMVEKYGLEVTSFVLENVSVPPEVEQAIDKRSSMSAIGNLNDYVKYQMGQAMANGGEGAAAATIPATMAMGFGMAQEMMKQMQQPAAGQPAFGAQVAHDAFSPAAAQAAQAPAPVAGLQVYTPEQAAQLLGVDVADVLAELEAGNLKGRKIGANWRIAQAALDAFLRG